MNENCLRCAAIDNCSVACEYGSIMCTIRRLQSGQTKAEEKKLHRNNVVERNVVYCPNCGTKMVCDED